jgi:hypothetical protein
MELKVGIKIEEYYNKEVIIYSCNFTHMMESGMGYGSMGLFGLLGLATWIVWLAVGILLAAYLWKKINTKE